MTLTQEEQDILDGKKGDVLAKVMKTVVAHGNAFGADKLVELGVAPASILAGGKGGVGSHKQGRFVLTDLILRKENDGRPTGKGVAGTVTPGNIEVENTSTGVGLAGADMP